MSYEEKIGGAELLAGIIERLKELKKKVSRGEAFPVAKEVFQEGR